MRFGIYFLSGEILFFSFLQIAFSMFSFPSALNKHTNYESPRCMGLSTEASSSLGEMFQDFDSLEGIGKNPPFYQLNI